jgi:hypothetical protein
MFDLPPPERCSAQFGRDGYLLVRAAVPHSVAWSLKSAAEQAVRSAGAWIDRRNGERGLAYRVVTGDVIRTDAQGLFAVYTSAYLLEWMRAVTSCVALSRSTHLRSAININCMTTPGDEYPIHRDAVPYTVLLFLSDVEPAAGGEFLIETAAGRHVKIQPRLGNLLLMDGTRCPHGAAPLRRAAVRMTLPMVYPAQSIERPDGLDDYLYAPDKGRVVVD